MKLVKIAATAAMAAVAVMGAAGCSGSTTPAASKAPSGQAVPAGSETVGTVFGKTKAHLDQAKSVHYVGELKGTADQTKIDFAGALDGTNQKESTESNMGKITILKIGTKDYTLGDEKYLAAGFPADKVKEYTGKWMTGKAGAPTESAAPEDSALSTPRAILKKFLTQGASAQLEKESKPAQKVGDNFVLTSSDGAEITVNSKDFSLVKLVMSPKVDPHGTLTFDQWDAVKPFTEPPATDIVEVEVKG